nr:PREDICTED: uncharacterized protein LOC109642552 [Paralichthys olivaceus]
MVDSTVYDRSQTNKTIIILCFCLVGLMVLLFYFYKKLNKESNGEYTIRRMWHKKGWIMDQGRAAALALGTGLGLIRSDSNEEEEEMQEVRDEEGQLVEGGCQGSDSEGSSQEEDEEDNMEQGKGDNTSHCTSSSVGSKAGEGTRLTGQRKANVEMEVKREEKEEEVKSKGEGRGESGLLIDLKQFSGSAIWSEEEKMEREVTSL